MTDDNFREINETLVEAPILVDTTWRESSRYSYDETQLWKLRWALLRNGVAPPLNTDLRVNLCMAQLGQTGPPTQPTVYLSMTEPHLPIVIDTVASFSLTPNVQDLLYLPDPSC